ncbi:hypothetical protein [Nodularia sphaerocarpa]|nr:hypothetical protein [Nodularia sphaerocarpa]MDB9374051.1 hypothetical protein [Nodularia sphaerocarpa CS-585]
MITCSCMGKESESRILRIKGLRGFLKSESRILRIKGLRGFLD